MKKALLFAAMILFSGRLAIAQEAESKEFKPKIRGAFMMANPHIRKATEGSQSVVIIPTWGFDVDYVFICAGPLLYREILNFGALRLKTVRQL
jgi:hypothetical protein